jgi:hypothetical protein
MLDFTGTRRVRRGGLLTDDEEKSLLATVSANERDIPVALGEGRGRCDLGLARHRLAESRCATRRSILGRASAARRRRSC